MGSSMATESWAGNSTMVSTKISTIGSYLLQTQGIAVPLDRPAGCPLYRSPIEPWKRSGGERSAGKPGLMMSPAMATRAVPCRCWSMGRFRNRNCRGIAQICREHQNQRRNDAKREKCVQRRQDFAQVARRTGGKSPGNCAGCKASQGRNRARARSDFELRRALRALDIVRARR